MEDCLICDSLLNQRQFISSKLYHAFTEVNFLEAHRIFSVPQGARHTNFYWLILPVANLNLKKKKRKKKSKRKPPAWTGTWLIRALKP